MFSSLMTLMSVPLPTCHYILYYSHYFSIHDIDVSTAANMLLYIILQSLFLCQLCQLLLMSLPLPTCHYILYYSHYFFVIHYINVSTDANTSLYTILQSLFLCLDVSTAANMSLYIILQSLFLCHTLH